MYVSKPYQYSITSAQQEIITTLNLLIESNNQLDYKIMNLESKIAGYSMEEIQKEKDELIAERKHLKIVLDKLPALVKKAIEEDNTDILRKWIENK